MISRPFSAILAITTIALRSNSDGLVSCNDVPSFDHGGTGGTTGDHSFNANNGGMRESFADPKFKNLQLHQKDNTGPDNSKFQMQLRRKEYDTIPDESSLVGAVVNNGLQDGDLQLLKDIVPDASRLATSEGEDHHRPSPDSQEALDQAINTRFASIVSNLAHNAGSEDFDPKLEAIKRAMESAFLRTAGYVDHAYVDGALDMIRAEVKQLKAAEDDP